MKTAGQLDWITVGDRPGLCQTASVGSRRRSMDTSTASPHRTLVAIPAYNEAATIRNVVERVRLNLPHCDLVVVNDGSTDATATALAGTGATVVEHLCNLDQLPPT